MPNIVNVVSVRTFSPEEHGTFGDEEKVWSCKVVERMWSYVPHIDDIIERWSNQRPLSFLIFLNFGHLPFFSGKNYNHNLHLIHMMH